MSQRLHVDPATLAKLAANERAHRRVQKRLALVLAIAVILGIGGLLYALNEWGQSQRAPVVEVDPAKLPPIRPGPPR